MGPISFVLFFFIQGVTRLADISLHNPVSISVVDRSHDQSIPKGRAAQDPGPPQTGSRLDSFAIPESLEQHVTLVPSKLRLVCLAAFILQKCKVGQWPGMAAQGRSTCPICVRQRWRYHEK